MNQDELKEAFDQQATGYEERQMKLAPVYEGIYFQLQWVFSGLPDNARILCVGSGVGTEISYLAKRFPNWRFIAVEPSGGMLDICRKRAEQEGFSSRCVFHEGYLDSLSGLEPCDGATCLMVSQFFLDKEDRVSFFQSIAKSLKHGGILVSSDLSEMVGSNEYSTLINLWAKMLHGSNVSSDTVDKIHSAWLKDVAILPPEEIKHLIHRGGFELAVQTYQACLVRAWVARRL